MRVSEAISQIRNSEASGINHRDIYGHDVDKDLAILGRAYLAEHPEDDDVLVTVEVLGETIPLIPGHGFVVTEVLSIFNSKKKGIRLYYTAGEGDSEPQPIADIKTRGQLRKLLSALRGE